MLLEYTYIFVGAVITSGSNCSSSKVTTISIIYYYKKYINTQKKYKTIIYI
jgi:hypothetical protein